LYSNLKELISAADIAVINQETILGGDEFPYSGYPNFNSPTQIGDAVIKAGFDVVLHATNHTMDKGLEGVKNDINYWKLHPEITVLGINETEKEREQIPIIDKNGIKIAMLDYTYGLNGYHVPKNMPYLVNMLDKNAMRADIKKAKELSDFVIVFPHWGTEYVYQPTKSQKDLTEFLYEQGVDLVIGTHPHVLEPVELFDADKDRRMLVYYSLGNFISYQREAPRMLGGIATVTITKDENGTFISDAGIIPIVTHYEKGSADYNYGIYKLSDYNEELAKVHGILGLEEDGKFTYQATFDLAKQILGPWFQ
jgi:poly-gamma-glutamate synthesis protein (capsule biosynthesis protein)